MAGQSSHSGMVERWVRKAEHDGDVRTCFQLKSVMKPFFPIKVVALEETPREKKDYNSSLQKWQFSEPHLAHLVHLHTKRTLTLVDVEPIISEFRQFMVSQEDGLAYLSENVHRILILVDGMRGIYKWWMKTVAGKDDDVRECMTIAMEEWIDLVISFPMSVGAIANHKFVAMLTSWFQETKQIVPERVLNAALRGLKFLIEHGHFVHTSAMRGCIEAATSRRLTSNLNVKQCEERFQKFIIAPLELAGKKVAGVFAVTKIFLVSERKIFLH